MPTCTKCDQDKGDDAFYWRKDRNCLRQPCKACHSEYGRSLDREHRRAISRKSHEKNREKNRPRERELRLLNDYGLTVEQYDEMLLAQDGVCAICRKPETVTDPRYGQVRALAVDHNHRTGEVRALLCARCNMAIGMLDDSDHTLEAAMLYLKAFAESL